MTDGGLPNADWSPLRLTPLVGLDVLQLFSSSMYRDPLSILREYIQNSVDAIEEAVTSGLLSTVHEGRIEVFIDPIGRSIRIRDNGVALSEEAFLPRLIAFGGSSKRGRNLRGFRGVGRLGGLGYCQELVFRSSRGNGSDVNELLWDGLQLRSHLRSEERPQLAQAMTMSVSHRSLLTESPGRFFEVELKGIPRRGAEVLLNQTAVSNYLAQVAPVPFSKEFPFGQEVAEFLRTKTNACEISISVNGSGPLRRPHGSNIPMTAARESKFNGLQLVELAGVDGERAAIGWIAHHDYLGAIPGTLGIRGLRTRVGNLQIGDETILNHAFPEERFGTWAVGEFHLLDTRIVPNGRRDDFETDVHYRNFSNQVTPFGRAISQLCRTKSVQRRKYRDVESLMERAQHTLSLIRLSRRDSAATRVLIAQAHQVLASIEHQIALDGLEATFCERYNSEIRALQLRLKRAERSVEGRSIPRSAAREKFFSALYECATTDSTRAFASAVIERLVTAAESGSDRRAAKKKKITSRRDLTK